VAGPRDNKHLFGGRRATDAPEKKPEADLGPDLDRLERDMNELRATYELFFMGVERGEPLPARNAVRADLRRLQESKPRNTSLKFRLQQAKARFVSLENHWNRINRERENGTYKRDVAKAERRQAELERRELAAARAQGDRTVAGAAAPGPDGQPITGSDLHPGRSAAVTAGGSAAPPAGASGLGRPRARSAEDLTEPHLQRLYQTYIGARRRCGESTDLRYEDMAASLRKQVPKLMAKTGAREVEFKVVIRGGHAVLKALPKGE
jgi:hypothetical protein